MKRFRFEIQNCIEVVVEGNTAEEARMKIMEHIDDYSDKMVDGSAFISSGVEENGN